MRGSLGEEEAERRLLILFGSETGNCEDLAKRLFWEARRRHFKAMAKAMDDYPVASLVTEPLVIFICSTTGQGDHPKNMTVFWRFIMRKALPKDSLSAVNCAVIGLGDSSYIKYNFVGKMLFKRLKQLGAQLLLDLALGDDQHDLGSDATVDPWLEQFWEKLNVLYPLSPGMQIVDPSVLPSPGCSFHFVENSFEGPSVASPALISYTESNPYKGFVMDNERVTPADHFQEVRLIKFQVPEEVGYNGGDVVMIQPENLVEEVDEFINLLGLCDDRKFVIEARAGSFPGLSAQLPVPCSVKELVIRFLDIHSVPKRSFFQLISKLSADETEKTKLTELSSISGQEEVYNYCLRPKRSILEVLQDFPKTTRSLSLEYLLDLIPGIKPRAFSIASSLNCHPLELHILIAVVNYRTRLKRKRLGLCSNYLARIISGQRVRLWSTKGSLKINLNKPLIMIGPGTGVAPFRSILEDRISRGVLDNCLFFGCRYKRADFYFQTEWTQYEARNALILRVAFSREDPEKKVYVQHKLWDEKKLIWDLMVNREAYVLVAGSSNQMPQDVRNTFIKIIEEEGGPEFEDPKAEKLVTLFESKGRIQYECWS